MWVTLWIIFYRNSCAIFLAGQNKKGLWYNLELDIGYKYLSCLDVYQHPVLLTNHIDTGMAI